MKIYDIDQLSTHLKQLREEGKKIVHCHGCFDLMHPGHIKYFQAAKKMGDLLVVTISPDCYVDKGSERPVFPEKLRAESVAALECVNFVSINKWPTAEQTLLLLRPDYYVKGQEFEHFKDSTGKIQREREVAEELDIKIRFTHEIVFSSTQLLNEYFLKNKD